MFEDHPNLTALRGYLVAVCLMLIAGCLPQTHLPPPVPTDLVATAADTQVSLTWSASTGATSYNVKRSTITGGPYTQIASPTTSSYTDTSLTDGTKYYYVVSAVNGNGESKNSAEVNAIPLKPFGTWKDVTPTGVDLTDTLDCGNDGAATVQADTAHPANVYTQFNCQGLWQSTDYGATWTGPINTGSNGSLVGDCAGGITVSPSSTAGAPTIYESCIRGSGIGFWKSVDGGVNWTKYVVAPSGTAHQDYYPPVIDPYDPTHLLMAAHEQNYIVESTDGGQNWTNVSLANGMLQNGATGFIFFLNTGTASSTRETWLWIGQASGGTYGTWRTANGGVTWNQVDKNEHPVGATQIYQPGTDGIVYMAGGYSALGGGVLRSSDYGQTWTHVGVNTAETVVIGTTNNVYAMFGYPIGIGLTLEPAFEVASQPGTGVWVSPGTPAGLTQGAAQFATVNDGTNTIIVGAMWNSGVWRYVEP